MSFNNFGIRDMVGLTGVWTIDMRSVFASLPQVAVWLPMLDDVHAGVVQAQRASEMCSAELVDLAKQQAAIDDRFDDMARTISLCIEAEYFHCRLAVPERAELCEKARKKLFPDGLNIIKMLYVTEAGHTRRVESMLVEEPWLKALLASISMSGGINLLSLVVSWCALGAQLSKLEGDKAMLSLTSSQAKKNIDFLAARNDWLRIVGTVLANLDVIRGQDATVAALRRPVDSAYAAVARRGSSGRNDGQPGDGECTRGSASAADATPTAPPAANPVLAAAAAPAEEIPVGMPGHRPYI